MTVTKTGGQGSTPLIAEWLPPADGGSFWQRLWWGRIRFTNRNAFRYETSDLPCDRRYLALEEARLFVGGTLRLQGGVLQINVPGRHIFTSERKIIPKPFWLVIKPWHPQYGKAFILLDLLYQQGVYNKPWADRIFAAYLTELGAPGWRRWLVSMAVRQFARGDFDK